MVLNVTNLLTTVVKNIVLAMCKPQGHDYLYISVCCLSTVQRNMNLQYCNLFPTIYIMYLNLFFCLGIFCKMSNTNMATVQKLSHGPKYKYQPRGFHGFPQYLKTNVREVF